MHSPTETYKTIGEGRIGNLRNALGEETFRESCKRELIGHCRNTAVLNYVFSSRYLLCCIIDRHPIQRTILTHPPTNVRFLINSFRFIEGTQMIYRFSQSGERPVTVVSYVTAKHSCDEIAKRVLRSVKSNRVISLIVTN